MEWYHPWANLAPTLTQYMDEEDEVLVCGCGNSEMSADMYDDGEHLRLMNAALCAGVTACTFLSYYCVQLIWQDFLWWLTLLAPRYSSAFLYASCDILQQCFHRVENPYVIGSNLGGLSFGCRD